MYVTVGQKRESGESQAFSGVETAESLECVAPGVDPSGFTGQKTEMSPRVKADGTRRAATVGVAGRDPTCRARSLEVLVLPPA